MKRIDDRLRLAASDITTFSACVHATVLDEAVALGQRPKPRSYPDPSIAVLQQRGIAHEKAYLARLRESYTVEEIPEHAADAPEKTLDAMRRGVGIIYQGTLVHGSRWLGRSDFLRRVDVPSWLGRWSYEPIDAKLALSAKAAAIVQLCFYAELLEHAQGVLPRRMSLVLGDLREESFATARYAAYFRYLRRRFEEALDTPPPTYPEPVAHCDVCNYAAECDQRRHDDDHLSLVAGITGAQRRALDLVSVRKVRQLASVPLGQRSPVEGIGAAAFTRIREQARIQVEGRDAGEPRYELLREVEPGCGLAMLPEPSPGDLFIDFEGDAYALGDGIEYLLGIVELPPGGGAGPTYTGLWALDRDAERASFERLMRLITERRARHPGMHVYHYSHYEPTALKRLAGRYATCVDELDALLRGETFVDLYRAMRQGVRASVESYSIKKLEPFFGFTRTVPLPEATRCLVAFEAWMELRSGAVPEDAVRTTIEGYNRDDCLSALRLRDWLEERRRDLVQSGVEVSRPEPASGEPPEELAEHLARVHAVAESLLEGVPADPEQRSVEETARYVLAHVLEWHRREDKSGHWEYHRLRKLTDDELQEDGTAIGGLTYGGVVGRVKRSLVHWYHFPPQDHAIDRALSIVDPTTEKGIGTLVRVDDDEGILELKREAGSDAPHPTALIPGKPLKNYGQRDSLLRLGEHVRTNGLRAVAPFSAAVALLRREPPRPAAEGASLEETAIARALAVDGSVLPIQGPPGTGKTYLGARMIVALVRAGKRVGVTANSHKVITNLLDDACKAAREQGVTLQIVQKSDEEEGSHDSFVHVTQDNAEVERAIASGEANVVAGTAWLWARPSMVGAVNVLFVDEAGQMSLANVLASAPAADGLVLLGDPQQLDQPQKGVHPPGTAQSALGYVLGDRATMDPAQGIFLEETWRMHPDVCGFISEVFYDGRLRSRLDLPHQRLDAREPLGGTGLRFVPVEHHGNRSESPEEVEVVAELVAALTDGRATWTDRHGQTHPIGLEDVLVVAPYNAQVSRIRKRLPPQARVGTVDKFQGQQAPVVIYSMATSSPEDAPRGAEFLYSGNRFNVAVSRARCAAFLVASPRLFEMRCQSERQMAVVNAFCRYLEIAGRYARPDGDGARAQ